jgi:hypothetical protein
MSLRLVDGLPATSLRNFASTWRGKAATKRETLIWEEHEVYDQKISGPFVSFANFVVRKSFVEWRIADKTTLRKLAQPERGKAATK